MWFDDDVGEINLHTKPNIIVVGGSAVILFLDSRTTVDIDTYSRLNNIQEIAERHDINNNVVGGMETPYGYEERMRKRKGDSR